MRCSWGIALLLAACSGDEFTSSSTGGAGGSTGGSGGNGASSAAGGIGGGTGGGFGGSAGGSVGGSSGSATGGSGGSIVTACQALCAKRTQKSCPNDPPLQACESGCQEALSEYYTICAQETEALVQCYTMNASVVCGLDGESHLVGCPAEFQAFGHCGGCLTIPGDSTCVVCEKEKCCTAIKAFYAVDTSGAYLDCQSKCTDPACSGSCAAQYGDAATALASVLECRQSYCTGCL